MPAERSWDLTDELQKFIAYLGRTYAEDLRNEGLAGTIDAGDITQMIRMQVHEQRDRFDPAIGGTGKAYVRKIAEGCVNDLRKYLTAECRSERKTESLDAPIGSGDDGEDLTLLDILGHRPEQEDCDSEDWCRAFRKQLSPAQLELLGWLEQGYDIAELHERKIGNAPALYRRLNRIQQKYRKISGGEV